ncbi:MAG: type II toxin-antitoxin system VapC family toxin [Anaerolineae bacterium]|nr:type II toxin-antitoxin system VapC family toxin [Anaerolineae bacterium]
MAIVAIDANVLVGLLDERDKWHGTAVAIRDALDGVDSELVYYDCVLNEAISVLARRTREQRRPEQLDALLDQLARLIPASDITWVSGEIQRLYDQVLGLIRSSAGDLNFHDALMALICREQDISVLVSFDQDFDQIGWLARVDSATGVAEVLRQLAEEGD